LGDGSVIERSCMIEMMGGGRRCKIIILEDANIPSIDILNVEESA
jgi:hypothetical protein